MITAHAVAGPAAVPPSPGGDRALFDCLTPFFTTHAGGSVNGWKIPFARLERDGMLDGAAAAAILAAARAHVAAMADRGNTAFSVGDLAHLVVHDFYPGALQRKLASYRALYDRLSAVVKARGPKLFAFTDSLFDNDAIEAHLEERRKSSADLFLETVVAAVAVHLGIDGVVLRFGESDGVDVADAFKSRFTTVLPRQARALPRWLLLDFEQRNLKAVFRTWTLGAYPTGDLMRNARTCDAVLRGIGSRNPIVSLNYGNADFFATWSSIPSFSADPGAISSNCSAAGSTREWGRFRPWSGSPTRGTSPRCGKAAATWPASARSRPAAGHPSSASPPAPTATSGTK